MNCSNNVSRKNLHRKFLKVVQKRRKNLATLEKKQKFLGPPPPPLPIPLRPSKKALEKLKFFKGKGKTADQKINTQNGQSYAQVFSFNIVEIVKIKENFPNLLSKKIEEVHKIISEPRKEKPRFNMTTKRPSRRQMLVPMSLSNSTKFMVMSCKHVAHINRALKDIKSDIMADFI